MRTPRTMRARPTPATTRRTPMAEEATARDRRRRGRRGALGSIFGPPGSLVHSMDSVAVHLHAAVSLLGRFPALAGVDLDVARGEVVLVQGPNGAGKTTLPRACAGLVAIVSGAAEVLGVDVGRGRRAVRRRVAVRAPARPLCGHLAVAAHGRRRSSGPGGRRCGMTRP